MRVSPERAKSTTAKTALLNLAALIAETGPLLERCDNPEKVAALCARHRSPRPRASPAASAFDSTAHKQAWVATSNFADTPRHFSPWACDCYRQARARVSDIRTPSESARAAGSASHVAPGPTTPPTTRNHTAANNDSPQNLTIGLKRPWS